MLAETIPGSSLGWCSQHGCAQAAARVLKKHLPGAQHAGCTKNKSDKRGACTTARILVHTPVPRSHRASRQSSRPHLVVLLDDLPEALPVELQVLHQVVQRREYVLKLGVKYGMKSGMKLGVKTASEHGCAGVLCVCVQCGQATLCPAHHHHHHHHPFERATQDRQAGSGDRWYRWYRSSP